MHLGILVHVVLWLSIVFFSVTGSAMKSMKVTVFVHGTRLFPKFYLQELFYSPQGLTRVAELEPRSHMHTIARVLSDAGPGRFLYEHFYAFGWDGKLNFAARQRAARDLYASLLLLKHTYQEAYGAAPELCLVTHSHGGNVVLNLPHVETADRDALRIKTLILLACPVQEKTKDDVGSDLFDTCYAFASFADCLQVIDPQGWYVHAKEGTPWFSKRLFPLRHLKMRQAVVNMNGRWMFHLEFFLRPFLSKLPPLLDALDAVADAHKGDDVLPVFLARLKKSRIEIVPMPGK